jgi:hypothetical protein
VLIAQQGYLSALVIVAARGIPGAEFRHRTAADHAGTEAEAAEGVTGGWQGSAGDAFGSFGFGSGMIGRRSVPEFRTGDAKEGRCVASCGVGVARLAPWAPVDTPASNVATPALGSGMIGRRSVPEFRTGDATGRNDAGRDATTALGGARARRSDQGREVALLGDQHLDTGRSRFEASTSASRP